MSSELKKKSKKKDKNSTKKNMSTSSTPTIPSGSNSPANGPVQTLAEKLAERQEHIRHTRNLYLIVNKKYLINFLSERYFSKLQMFLIFIPIQMLAVWATISKPMFAYFNSTPAGSPSEEGVGDILIDTLVGSALLILTNLGKALSYEKKAEQHKMIADEMKAAMDDIEVHINTLPNQGWDRNKSKTIYEKVQTALNNSVEMNKKLSPPDQIVMAFDNLNDDMTFLMTRRQEGYGATSPSDGCKSNSTWVKKIKAGYYEVDEETYFNLFKDGYSDLADIISSSISHFLRFAFLPSSKDTRYEVIEGLVESLDRIGGYGQKEKSLCDRLFRTHGSQSEEKMSLTSISPTMDTLESISNSL